jgi:flagellar biosynthesis/type III secretory pathway chaperone
MEGSHAPEQDGKGKLGDKMAQDKSITIDENRNYINMMIQSLEKKLKVLGRISERNRAQHQILLEDELDYERMKQNLEDKSKLIEQLEFLDSGFEKLYVQVKETLDNDRNSYKTQILKMQDLIRAITDKSATVQTQEQRNKTLLDQHFATSKKRVKTVRTNAKVANLYKRAMIGTGGMEPAFWDKKK